VREERLSEDCGPRDGARRGPGSTPSRLSPAALLALGAVFGVVSLAQIAPALHGEFLADDESYIVHNVYVHDLSWENLKGILDPWGEPTAYTANYAPVHLLLHALEYQAFGLENRAGWHAVNAVAHAIASLVLVAFFLRAGLSVSASVFGGALFLTHPANLETVAWIFQLKTLVSLGLALGALLLLERRPLLATVLFALALLTKVTALFALPVAVVQVWVRAGQDGRRARWAWLGVWAGIGVAVSVIELQAYGVQQDPRIDPPADLGVHAQTIVAIAGRYLAMAYTSLGLSTFHSPPPLTSWIDPWWLGGLAALAVLGGRAAVTLWRREEEAAFWVLAAVSFAPVSQITPFIYPMGDRYLYPILPGLIGGTLLALRHPARRLLAGRRERQRELLRVGAVAGAVALLTAMSLRSHERAPVFGTTRTMMLDAALHYPDGLQAHLLRGSRAAREGNAQEAARSYSRAVELGFSDLHSLVASPALAPVRGHPDFQAVIQRLADHTIARIQARDDPSQMELASLAQAYEIRGERERAIRAYERALQQEGPLGPAIRSYLRQIADPSGGPPEKSLE